MKNTNKDLMEKVTNEFMKISKGCLTIDYWLKNHCGFVELDGGYIFFIDKPRIETRFCFGYGWYAQSTEEEEKEALKQAENARKFEYFYKENIDKIQNKIDLLNNEDYKHFLFASYVNENCLMVEVSGCKWFELENRYNNCKDCIVRELTQDDKEKIIAALEVEKEKFSKRLKTYWKKYQDTKLTIWTYNRD